MNRNLPVSGLHILGTYRDPTFAAGTARTLQGRTKEASDRKVQVGGRRMYTLRGVNRRIAQGFEAIINEPPLTMRGLPNGEAFKGPPLATAKKGVKVRPCKPPPKNAFLTFAFGQVPNDLSTGGRRPRSLNGINPLRRLVKQCLSRDGRGQGSGPVDPAGGN